jgi:hypothetical protein
LQVLELESCAVLGELNTPAIPPHSGLIVLDFKQPDTAPEHFRVPNSSAAIRAGGVLGFVDESIPHARPASALSVHIPGAYVFSGLEAICHRARLFVMTRTSKIKLDVMRKAEYQLVLQFPCNSLEEFDAVVALEGALMAELSGALADVDGHDAGSGEANIFILTSEPDETFERVHAVVGKASRLAQVLRAGYRKLDAEVYLVLWPPGETRFAVA